ncbi:putative Mitochondrial inner membrane protease subunit 1 [Hypsibius exemplaris]|uniref:Mitochondrial inner membrane protease subunit n=1 Tax=Hypsibius exemplaris TaxID=2072580 RepID=A0A9X6NEF1_HYPEX|nr:putative Mitochondrial inner membrane protease subunit 1 [Hypsibius exemplaris]
MNRLFVYFGGLFYPFCRAPLLLTTVRRTASDRQLVRPKPESFLRSIPRRTFWFAGQVFKFGCILYFVNAYVVDFFVCIGPSMEPTIQSHDIVITEHFTQRFRVLKRGDLVVARSPVSPTIFICKRIVGKAGDLVHDEHRNVVKVPRGYVWLEGDNAQDSIDSRRYGPVPEALIRSKLCLRLWPFARFGRIPDYRRPAQPGEDLVDTDAVDLE